MSFDFLFAPAEGLDSWLAGLFEGAPLPVALGVALVLGARHASDPDHLVAVTSVVAADDGDHRDAMRLAAWWGVGHAATLILIGLPLIAFRSEFPAWLESGAEQVVGVVIVVLALRVMLRWSRGPVSDKTAVRTSRQAVAIGLLHGLAGTGAVVLLLLAALPTQIEAAAALAAFAPMSVASMTMLTGAFAWTLTRPGVEPVYRTVLVPALGLFGLLFGVWYAGIT